MKHTRTFFLIPASQEHVEVTQPKVPLTPI